MTRPPYQPADIENPIHPNYSVVCLSRRRLGACEIYYWVKDSLAGVAPDGTRICWLAVVDAEEVSTPTCIEVFGNPEYDLVIASYGAIGTHTPFTFIWKVMEADAFCAPWKTLYLTIE